MSKRPAHVAEVRPVRPDDGPFLSVCAWVATDSEGRRFGGDTEADARERAEAYNHPRQRRTACRDFA